MATCAAALAIMETFARAVYSIVCRNITSQLTVANKSAWSVAAFCKNLASTATFLLAWGSVLTPSVSNGFCRFGLTVTATNKIVIDQQNLVS